MTIKDFLTPDLIEREAAQAAGAVFFGGKDSTIVDYLTYLSIPLLAREAARRGIEAAKDS